MSFEVKYPGQNSDYHIIVDDSADSFHKIKDGQLRALSAGIKRKKKNKHKHNRKSWK